MASCVPYASQGLGKEVENDYHYQSLAAGFAMPFETAIPLETARPVVNLGNVSKGFRGRIVRVGGPDAGELERRLLEIGFVEGAPVEVVHEGPVGGDPIAIRVNETVVALRRREANAILAEPAR